MSSPYHHPQIERVSYGVSARYLEPPCYIVKLAPTGDVADLTAASVSIDGGTAVEGDVIALINQSDATENGVYFVGAVAGGAAALTRSIVMSSETDEVMPGTCIFVSQGTTNGNKRFQLTTDQPIVIGTSNLVFAEILTDAALAGGAVSAAEVPITDAGNYYAGTNVEAALQEVRSDLAATTNGNGASLVGIEDAATRYTATNVEAALAEVKALANASPSMQAANATLVNGTVTINAGITVAANSEVVPVLIGALSGTTNLAQVGELKASRVNGAPGAGTVVIQAYGDDGAIDVDAAGAIRVLIFTPQV